MLSPIRVLRVIGPRRRLLKQPGGHGEPTPQSRAANGTAASWPRPLLTLPDSPGGGGPPWTQELRGAAVASSRGAAHSEAPVVHADHAGRLPMLSLAPTQCPGAHALQTLVLDVQGRGSAATSPKGRLTAHLFSTQAGNPQQRMGLSHKDWQSQQTPAALAR